MFPIGGVEDCTESRPVARDAIDVQPVFLMERLRRSHQVLLELVAQVYVDLVEAAFAVAEFFEVLVDVLPLRVLLLGLVLEIGQKTTLHLLLVEEVVAFVDDALEATAAQGLGLLAHVVIVVTFTQVLRLGIDVDTQRLMAHDLHRRFITIAWIVVQIV